MTQELCVMDTKLHCHIFPGGKGGQKKGCAHVCCVCGGGGGQLVDGLVYSLRAEPPVRSSDGASSETVPSDWVGLNPAKGFTSTCPSGDECAGPGLAEQSP